MFVCVLCDGGEEKRERVWRESQTDGAKRYPAVPRGHEKSPPTTKHVVNHLSSPQYIVYPLLLRRRQSHQNRFLLKRRHFLIERLANPSNLEIAQLQQYRESFLEEVVVVASSL